MMRVKKITELNRISVEEFKEIEKIPLTVVLDNVRSLNNIGSLFRTSDAFRVKKIYLCGITATPPHVDIHKTALGAEDSVEWAYVENTKQAVEILKKEGVFICAVEQTTESVSLEDFDFIKDRDYAIVLGNEVHGVEQSVVDECDCAVEIPQAGTKHSLNVSIAGGIIIWEFYKNLYTL